MQSFFLYRGIFIQLTSRNIIRSSIQLQQSAGCYSLMTVSQQAFSVSLTELFKIIRNIARNILKKVINLASLITLEYSLKYFF